MRLPKTLALLMVVVLCFTAGVYGEAQYHLWQPALDAAEGYVLQTAAGVSGWLNLELLVAVVSIGIILNVLLHTVSRLRIPRSAPPVPYRERVAAQRMGSRARG